MTPDRLSQQLAFVLEIDRLKQVNRQTLIADGSRRENDAEHSWHLAVMANLLAEYAPPGADIDRVTRMLLLHDVVEIHAGDTSCYDEAACLTQADRERAAADRIFALLPSDQAKEFRTLWEEFESRQTPESRFAAALDRVQPVLPHARPRLAGARRHPRAGRRAQPAHRGRRAATIDLHRAIDRRRGSEGLPQGMTA